MRKLTLERFSYSPHGTMGRLTLPSGIELYTLEPPWNNNQPNISCIPEGEYRVKRDTTGRHKFYRVQDVPSRSAIEFHAANYYINPKTGKQELWGCIAPGFGININHNAGITRSQDACKRLLDEMGGDDWLLNITHFEASYAP